MSTYYYKHNHTATRLHMLGSLAAVVLGVSSCAPPFAGDDTPADGGTPVSFAAQSGWNNVTDGGNKDEDGTRLAEGADGTAFERGDAIGMFAYKNDSSTPDFMNNQSVTFDGTNWNYTPTKYWPQNDGDRLSFFATSPYSAVAKGDIKIASTDEGHPTAIYDNTRADIDWTVAKREDVTYATGMDGVKLDFQHLTARVKFRFVVVGETETEDYRPVVHLLQYDVPHIVGTTQFADGADNSIASACEDQGSLVTLKRFVSLPEGVSVSRKGATIDEFTVYLLPCSFPCDGNATTTGSFTISLNNIAYTVTPKEQIKVERGKSYTVNFNIQKTNDTSNFFITSYSIWEDGGEYEGTLE